MYPWISQLERLNFPPEHASTLALWDNMSTAWDKCRDGTTLIWLARALASGDIALETRIQTSYEAIATALDSRAGNAEHAIGDIHSTSKWELQKASGYDINARPWSFPFGYTADAGERKAELMWIAADAFRQELRDLDDMPRSRKTRLSFLANVTFLMNGRIKPLTDLTVNDDVWDAALDVRWKDAILSDELWQWQFKRTIRIIAERTGLSLGTIDRTFDIAPTRDAAAVDVMENSQRPIAIGRAELRVLECGGLELSFLGIKLLPGDRAKEFAQHVCEKVAERKAEVNG